MKTETPDPKPEVPTLKPCPFCGGKAAITRVGTARYSTLVECQNCNCKLESGETFNHGSQWNTRQIERENAELQKVLSDLMPFVLEDYYANCATMEYREAVEAARAAIKSATP